MRATWFEQLGICVGRLCTRKATGRLRGERNEDMGAYCDRCARAKIAHDKATTAGDTAGRPGNG